MFSLTNDAVIITKIFSPTLNNYIHLLKHFSLLSEKEV